MAKKSVSTGTVHKLPNDLRSALTSDAKALTVWQNPMVELIPIEKSADKWIEYWLPHIQIDIDTTLTEEEIKKHTTDAFGSLVKPFSITIDNVVYIVRNRLGVVDGVNIILDLATNSRDVKYQRQTLFEKVD